MCGKQRCHLWEEKHGMDGEETHSIDSEKKLAQYIAIWEKSRLKFAHFQWSKRRHRTSYECDSNVIWQPIHCTLNGYQTTRCRVAKFSAFSWRQVWAQQLFHPGFVLNSYCWWSGQQLWHSTHFNSLTCVVNRYLAHSYGRKRNRYCRKICPSYLWLPIEL